MRRSHTAALSILVLLIASEPLLAGKKKPTPTPTPTPTPAPTPAPDPQASAPPAGTSAGSGDPVLDAVEGKLCAYATGDARSALEPILGRNDAAVKIALGRVLEQEKRYGDAERELRAAAQAAGDDPAPLVYLGETFLHASRQGDADNAFQQALDRASRQLAANGEDATAHYFLGVARQRLRQFGGAVEALQRARELRPDHAMTLYQLGATKAFQERWSEAVELLDRALERDSGIAYAYYYRGLCYGKLNRKDKLINDLERFLALAAHSPEAAAAKRMVDATRR